MPTIAVAQKFSRLSSQLFYSIDKRTRDAKKLFHPRVEPAQIFWRRR